MQFHLKENKSRDLNDVEVKYWRFDEKGQLRYSQHKVTVSKTQTTFETKMAKADTVLADRLSKIRGLRKKYGHRYSVKVGKIKLDAALDYALKETLADFDRAFDKRIKQRIADDQELAGEFGL